MGSKKGTNVSTISGGYLKEQMPSSSTMCIIMNHINITNSSKPILKFIDIPGTNHTFLTKSTSQALYSQVVGQN